MAALRPLGVTNQSYRFQFLSLPGKVEDLMGLMRPALDLALACEPHRIFVAYTLEYMPDGIAAAPRLLASVGNFDEAQRQIAALRAVVPDLTLATEHLPRIGDPEAFELLCNLLRDVGL